MQAVGGTRSWYSHATSENKSVFKDLLSSSVLLN